jgi:hypothetical protein
MINNEQERVQRQRGGPREGSGRPATDRKVSLSVRISREAADKLATVKNKSEFIDTLIKRSL